MIEVERSARLHATPEVLWALVSSPDHLLRLVGLDDTLPSQSQPCSLDLHEPDTFDAPQAVDVRVTVHDGPLTDATIHVQLTELGEQGTDLQVRLRATPRPSWTEFLTTPRVQRFFDSRLQRQLADLALTLSGRGAHHPRPPPLTEAASRHVEQAFAETDPAAGAAVVARLRRAPLEAQSVLRPREIALQDGLPLDAVFDTLLMGVQRGVLELEWAVLCPQSRNAEADGQRIHQDDLHCAACGVRFRSGLEHSMEVVFRPRAPIRPERLHIDRLMRGRTPSTLARHKVDLRQSLDLTLDLEPGRYLLESNAGSLVVDVDDEHPPSNGLRMVFGADEPAFSARVAPGSHRVTLVNPLTHVVRVTVSRRWRPPWALTAATIFDTPKLRAQLPSALLAPECEVFWGCVLTTECDGSSSRKRVAAILGALAQPEHVSRLPNGEPFAAFPDPVTALLAAEQMAVRQLSVGLGFGVGLVNRLGARSPTLRGDAVDRATQALADAGRPQYAVHEQSIDAMQQAIDAHGRAVSLREREGRAALLVFAAVVDGAPTLPVDDFTPEGAPDRAFSKLEGIRGLRIVGTIDKGGVGEVLEVEDPHTHERFAAKVLHPQLASERFVQLFHKEGYYASQLHHPNIVRTVDWGDEAGRPFLLMERLHGRDLYREVRKAGPLTLRRTVDVLCGVLDALAVIHAKGLVHRDIKPHNIYLLEDPDLAPYGVKLLDFGLMRPAGFSRDERFAGTPEFMAPEQLELGDVDPRADLYAAGALAFFVHTGKPPFKGKTRGEGAVLRLEGGLPEAIDPDVLGPLTPVIERALQLDKDARWPDATAMRDALVDASRKLPEP